MTKKDAEEILKAIKILEDSLNKIAAEVISVDPSYKIDMTQRWIVSDNIQGAICAFKILRKHEIL